MRTVIFIVAGLMLAGLALRLAPAAHRAMVAGAFTLVWFCVSAWNLRTGLSHGYTLAEELPIHVALFGLPVAAAWLAWWWQR